MFDLEEDGSKDVWMYGCMDEWMDGWMGGSVGGRSDGRVDGGRGRRTDRGE